MSNKKQIYVKEILDENLKPLGKINPIKYLLGTPIYNVLSNGDIMSVDSGKIIGKKINGKIMILKKEGKEKDV